MSELSNDSYLLITTNQNFIDLAMTKKVITFFILGLLSACSTSVNKEAQISNKSSAASDRINASESNSQGVFKELDD